MNSRIFLTKKFKAGFFYTGRQLMKKIIVIYIYMKRAPVGSGIKILALYQFLHIIVMTPF